ncbi:MAG: DUF4097 domain-containing protein [Vicinamibacteria bacterium]
MHARFASVLALLLTLGVGAPAQAQSSHDSPAAFFESLGNVMADLFLGPEVRESFHWEGKLARGSLEIKGVNGSIKAITRSGDAVVVHAIKRGRRSEPSQVEIELVEHAGGLTICAVYPAPAGKPANECAPGKTGRMAVRNNDVAVDFDVTLPEKTPFVARTVNGSIEASGLQADVTATSVNGSLKVISTGRVRAETVNGGVRIEAASASAESVNGSIHARLASTDWSEPLAFETVNGAVRLTLPEKASTALDVKTTNGSIRSDFDLQGERRTRRALSGTIGAGGRTLSVRTVNGSVRVKKAL